MIDPGVGSGERRERAGGSRSLEVLAGHPRISGFFDETWHLSITAHSRLIAAGAEVEPRPAVAPRAHQRYARGDRIEDGKAEVQRRRRALNAAACWAASSKASWALEWKKVIGWTAEVVVIARSLTPRLFPARRVSQPVGW